MDKTNLKSLKDVGLDLLDLSTKLVEVAETLDAIVASEVKAAKEEAKKPKAKKTAVEEKPVAKKRGRPAKAK